MRLAHRNPDLLHDQTESCQALQFAFVLAVRYRWSGFGIFAKHTSPDVRQIQYIERSWSAGAYP